MTPQLEQFVNQMYDTVKADYPGHSEFKVKSAILAAVRDYGRDHADAMITVHVLSEQVKALAGCARYL